MSNPPKCKAKGGASNCNDPKCPEKLYLAGLAEQGKTAEYFNAKDKTRANNTPNKIFGFLSKKKTNKVKQDRILQVRSYSGVLYHFVPTQEGELKYNIPALCGYNNWVTTNTEMEAVPSEVANSKDKQHSNWGWCPECAEKLTGVPAQEFIDARKSN